MPSWTPNRNDEARVQEEPVQVFQANCPWPNTAVPHARVSACGCHHDKRLGTQSCSFGRSARHFRGLRSWGKVSQRILSKLNRLIDPGRGERLRKQWCLQITEFCPKVVYGGLRSRRTHLCGGLPGKPCPALEYWPLVFCIAPAQSIRHHVFIAIDTASRARRKGVCHPRSQCGPKPR